MEISNHLLPWYYENRRPLPFRQDPTPYHIWISEIMLQQTRVAAVLPYYERFMTALPDVSSLARCPDDTLLKLWEGLGYYSRAHNLKKAAQMIVAQHGGELPADYDALLQLPGVGPYTAGAIASIAFGLQQAAVDGNVLRVFSRLYARRESVDLPAVKKELTALVKENMPEQAGDYNQAIMELGALVCLPGTPKCPLCPLQAQCQALALGIARELPQRTPKQKRTQHALTGFIVLCQDQILLQKRPDTGLLAGLWQPLLVEKKLDYYQAQAYLKSLLPQGEITMALPEGRHVFTHKVWDLQGWLCTCPQIPKGLNPSLSFVPRKLLQSQYPIPSAFQCWTDYLYPSDIL